MADKCITDAVKKLDEEGIVVDEKDLLKILDDVQARFEEANALTNHQKSIVVDEMLKENSAAVELVARNKMMNLRARVSFFQRANEIVTANPKATYFDVLEADLVGSNVNMPGYRNSVDIRTDAIKAEYVGNFLYELDEAGLTKLVTSNRYNPDNVAKELYAMDKEITLNDVKHEQKVRSRNQKYDVYDGFESRNVSGDREAFAIAKIMAKSQHEMVLRANRAGAFIKLRNDYIVQQSHNPSILKKRGFEQWQKDIMPLLDEAETFKDLDVIDQATFLKSVYTRILYGKTDNVGNTKILSNTANRVSRARVIHFKDADAFMEYNKTYGKKEFMETYLSTINNLSRDISMMEKFGPSPEQTFEKLVSDISFKYTQEIREGAPNKKAEGQLKEGYRRKLRHYFNEVSGATNIPVIGWKGNLGRFVRMLHNMSKLGGAAISATADAGFLPFEAKYQGMGFTKAFFKGVATPVIIPLKNIFANKSRKQQLQLARQIGVGMDYLTASAMDRFTVDDGVSGVLGRAQKKFFKLNGLTWITDAYKTSFAMMSANNLGVKRNMAYEDIGSRLQSVLSKYNIGQKEWDLIRKSAFESPDDGNWYITPDKIRYLSNEDVATYTGKENLHPQSIRKIKADLETALRAFFVDRADYASPTPGAKERAFMYKSMQPGTAWGEVARFFWQFKSFAVTIANRIWGREISGKYNNTSMTARMTGMLAMTTATGLVAATVKQVIRGETPTLLTTDWEDLEPKDLLKLAGMGLVQGGGLGIYGDLIFSTRTRYGQTAIETIGGPTVSLLSDILKIPGIGWSEAEKAAMGKSTSFGKRAAQGVVRTGKGMLPMGNYPIVKPLLDTYVWYRINEALSPGYMRRLRRSQRKDNREFWIEPDARYLEDDIQDLFD